MNNKDIWRKAVLPETSTVGEVISNLDNIGFRIALVVDKDNKFLGTISDGDIRRGLLKGLNLDSPINDIIFRNPLVVPPGISRDLVVQMMMANKIYQIPAIDDDQQLVGLHLWDKISTTEERSNIMVIMAGGKGTRLMPYTDDRPKPMVEVAGKPMLEHIIERAKLDGFNHFVLAIHHLGNIIEDYFGNGECLDVKIDYLRENSPLGTAGALSLLNIKPNLPFVVTNGDVLSDIRYGDILDFHNLHEASGTMAVRIHEWQHPFGVVEMQGIHIIGFEEKPLARSHINAGIYVLSPVALDELKLGESCNMPILFERLKAKSKITVAYPMHEPWLDVGRPSDFESANNKLKSVNKKTS